MFFLTRSGGLPQSASGSSRSPTGRSRWTSSTTSQQSLTSQSMNMLAHVQSPMTRLGDVASSPAPRCRVAEASACDVDHCGAGVWGCAQSRLPGTRPVGCRGVTVVESVRGPGWQSIRHLDSHVSPRCAGDELQPIWRARLKSSEADLGRFDDAYWLRRQQLVIMREAPPAKSTEVTVMRVRG